MLKIIWYGSLLSEESARKTCNLKNFWYWYIKWYKRIFNKLSYDPSLKKYHKNMAVLNIFAWKKDDWLLVSYFDIYNNDDFKKLKEREFDYKEQEVEIYDLSKKKISKWILFIAEEYTEYQWKQKKILFSEIKPNKKYLDFCLSAVKNTEFYDDFLDSTYTSCKKETLREYIKNLD